MEIIKGASSIM